MTHITHIPKKEEPKESLPGKALSPRVCDRVSRMGINLFIAVSMLMAGVQIGMILARGGR